LLCRRRLGNVREQEMKNRPAPQSTGERETLSGSLGADHPMPWEEHPVDHVFATTALTDKQKVAILGGHAARVFGMKEA
jgi:hypothetical protein